METAIAGRATRYGNTRKTLYGIAKPGKAARIVCVSRCASGFRCALHPAPPASTWNFAMNQHLNYITLGVADLAASRRFYREIFGWQERDDSNDHIAFFQAGSALILALFPREALAADATVAADGSGFPRFTLAHNVASREAVDALFAAFVAQGVTIVKPPQAVFWGGYSGYISDPDGFLWEIAHNPYLEKLR